MMQPVSRPDECNPFSTRFVRPGAIEYLFAEDENAEQLIERLSANGWRGAIVGPHGSGKSTLLAMLVSRLNDRGIPVRWTSLHDGQRSLPRGWDRPVNPTASLLLVIDGYEQLSRWSRWRLGHRCRRSGWGLLVTAHRKVAPPTIFETTPTQGLMRAVFDRVLPVGVTVLTPEDADNAFVRAGGNIREALFDLYDRYERRQILVHARTLAGLDP